MNLKALLWKEYRQSRQLLLSCAVLLLLPYLVVVVIWLVGALRFGQQVEAHWVHSIAIASMTSLFTSAVLVPFVAAQVMAGERADRSAEFVGYLPIPRASAVIAKVIFAVGVGALMLLANGLVGAWCDAVEGMRPDSYGGEVKGLFGPTVASATLMFGVSWGVAAFVKRPSTAAASGLGAVIILLMILAMVEETLGRGGSTSTLMYPTAFLSVGSACFAAGVVCSLRRVEP